MGYYQRRRMRLEVDISSSEEENEEPEDMATERVNRQLDRQAMISRNQRRIQRRLLRIQRRNARERRAREVEERARRHSLTRYRLPAPHSVPRFAIRDQAQDQDEARVRAHQAVSQRVQNQDAIRDAIRRPGPVNVPPGVPLPGMMTDEQFEDDLFLLQTLCDVYRRVGMQGNEARDAIVQMVATRIGDWRTVARRHTQDRNRARQAREEARQHNEDALNARREDNPNLDV